ncbi:MAG: hypothetical protein ACPGR2_01930 [Psychrobium sp.]
MSNSLKQATLDKFKAWHTDKPADYFLPYINLRTQSLNKREVAKAAGFSYNALKPQNGNPDLIEALKNLEDQLRKNGVLAQPTVVTSSSKKKSNATTFDPNERNNALNARRLAQLEKENLDLRDEIRKLEMRLERSQRENERHRETILVQNEIEIEGLL